jgi:hypothetical protein
MHLLQPTFRCSLAYKIQQFKLNYTGEQVKCYITVMTHNHYSRYASYVFMFVIYVIVSVTYA